MDSADFFEQWEIYRKIVDHNYMVHDEIGETITSLLRDNAPVNRLLDLGCGDAELPSRFLDRFPTIEYHGVDLAADPLRFARKNLQSVSNRIHLHQADQVRFISETEILFDIVMLGYSFHHVPGRDEKRSMLRSLNKVLSPGGILVIYDIFTQSGESREAYADRYLDWMRKDWTALTDREFDLVDSHIRANDHPESLETIQSLAIDAGLTGTKAIKTFDSFHSLIVIYP